MKQYKCEMCGGVFVVAWTDEEAKQEAAENSFDVAECGIICDDCYKLTPWGNHAHPKSRKKEQS